jgi:hypothetical protein
MAISDGISLFPNCCNTSNAYDVTANLYSAALFSKTSCAQRSVAMFDMVTPLLLLLPSSAAAAAPAPCTIDTS